MINSLVGARQTVLAVLGTVLALSLSTPAHAAGASAAAAAPEGSVSLEVLAANGSGCAPGTATVTGNRDKSGFRIRYSAFEAAAGTGTDITDRRKNCQVAVLITVPAGWTFAIAKAEYRGRVKLRSGATGLQRTNYYWQGSSDNNTTDDSFSGPLYGYWDTSDVAGGLIYSSCSEERVLNINTELRVDGGSSAGKSTMSMKSSEGDVDTLFNFSWIRC